MTTITWQIEYMDVATQPIDGQTQVVLTAGWRCNGTDGTHTASNYGSCSFPQPTTGSQFTPYNQLTQSQVLGWCYENGVNQSATEEAVTNHVNNLVNPPVTQPPLPWAPQITPARA